MEEVRSQNPESRREKAEGGIKIPIPHSAFRTPHSALERGDSMARYPIPEPFIVNIPEAVLTDLRERLNRVRWPGEIPDSSWDYGANLAYIKGLVEYWQTRYDWRAQERQLNRWHHFRVTIEGQGLHFIHERGNGPNHLTL